MFIGIHVDSIGSFIGSIIALTFALYYITSYLIVKKEQLNLILSLFMFSLMTYLLGYAMYSSGHKVNYVLFWTRICYSGGAVILYTGYLLKNVITNTKSKTLHIFVLVIMLLNVTAIFLPTDLIFTSVLNPEKLHSTVIKGPFFPVLLLMIFIPMLILVISLISTVSKKKDSLYLSMPLLVAIGFTLLEALYDGIFVALLSFTNKRQAIGPMVMIFSLALYSGRYSEMKNRELIRIKAENRQITEILIYDKLSNLFSRAYFIQILNQRIALREREDFSDCLMFIDIDNFKSINDSLGHNVGDKVIRHMGKTLKHHTRKSDVCARYGGDEFLVLLKNCHKSESLRIAQSIQNAFSAELSILLNDWEGSQNISLSIGVVDYQQWPNNSDDLIKNADMAMYEAKHTGKNKTVLYSATIDYNMQQS